MNPIAAIGIPTYNRGEMLRQAVGSVIQQTARTYAMVYDDGSRESVMQTLAGMFSELALVAARWPENHGIAYAKNQALEMALATGADLIGILDSDDWHKPEFVERCVTVLNENPDVGLVYTDDSIHDTEGNYIRTDEAAEWSIEALLRCQLRGDGWLCRREFAAQVRHDERFELDVDYDLFYQLARLTTFKRIPEALHCVRIHEGRTSLRDREKAAYWHAAGLAKYGHPIDWAMRRAEGHPEWFAHIDAGYRRGLELRD